MRIFYLLDPDKWGFFQKKNYLSQSRKMLIQSLKNSFHVKV